MPVSIEGRGSGTRSPGLDLLELHEDEVPEFEEPVAVLVRRCRAGRPQRLALVVENFRTGTAGAGVAHRPEIVGRRDADDAAVGEAGDLLPQIEGLIVGVIDGDEQAVVAELEFLGDQLPGELDRVGFEIVAEGEIAEHLEERVVARGIADIVEIVVLAAGAHAFLRRWRRGCRAASRRR